MNDEDKPTEKYRCIRRVLTRDEIEARERESLAFLECQIEIKKQRLREIGVVV